MENLWLRLAFAKMATRWTPKANYPSTDLVAGIVTTTLFDCSFQQCCTTYPGRHPCSLFFLEAADWCVFGGSHAPARARRLEWQPGD